MSDHNKSMTQFIKVIIIPIDDTDYDNMIFSQRNKFRRKEHFITLLVMSSSRADPMLDHQQLIF